METNHAILIAAAALLAGLNTTVTRAAEENWPQFLGPGSRAVTANADLPDRWSATANVAWKTAVPGRGCRRPSSGETASS